MSCEGGTSCPQRTAPSPPQGQGCAVSALCSPTHYPIQPMILSHRDPALPPLVFPRVWEPSRGAGAEGERVRVCAWLLWCRMFHLTCSTPLFWGCLLFGAVVLGRIAWGSQWMAGVGVVPRVVAVDVQPCASGCWVGQRGCCLLRKGVRSCPLGMLGLLCFVLSSRQGPLVPLGAPVPWHYSAAGETEAQRDWAGPAGVGLHSQGCCILRESWKMAEGEPLGTNPSLLTLGGWQGRRGPRSPALCWQSQTWPFG